MNPQGHRLATTGPQTPQQPSNPAQTLQQGIGSVMQTAFSPIEGANLAIATTTNAVAQALPSYPAATAGMLTIGLPHGHTHPPSLVPPVTVPVPLPVLGPITLGCSVQVLINGMPAARVGDMGFNPTCVGLFPSYEIFTGSSKVYIGGMRAARTMDVTMHCWPPKSWLARGAVAALVAAAKAAMMAMMVAGTAAQVSGVIGDAMASSDSDAAGQDAMASAQATSAAMAAAQMAADAAAMAVGAVMGKDPATPPGGPMGAVSTGHSSVLIGGFPMPSGMQIAGRALAGAKSTRSRGSQGCSGRGC